MTLLEPGLYKYKTTAQTALKKHGISLICKRKRNWETQLWCLSFCSGMQGLAQLLL